MSKKQKYNPYHGLFGSWQDVVDNFSGQVYYDEDKKMKIKEPSKVIYADYEIDGYDGGAFVLWREGRKYYMLQGGHCSCYGLEETGWNPEEFKSKAKIIEYLNKIVTVWPLNLNPKELIKEL